MLNKTLFTAVYHGGYCYLNGKELPAGSIAVDLLNDYYVDDAILRFGIGWNSVMPLLWQLEAGHVTEEQLLRTGSDLLRSMSYLPQITPFSSVDLTERIKRVEELFSAETASMLNSYFHLFGRVSTRDPNDLALGFYGPDFDQDYFRRCEKYIQEIKDTLDHIYSIGDDAQKFRQNLINLMWEADETLDYSPSHLLTMALDIFEYEPFDTQTEYISFQPNSNEGHVIATKIHFPRYGSLLLTDFFEGLSYGYHISRCEICNKFFLVTSNRQQKYCDGLSEEVENGCSLTCRQVAAKRNQKEAAADDPRKELYRKRCACIRSEVSRGTITKEFGEQAKLLAKEYLDRAIADADYAREQYLIDMSREKLYTDVKERFGL